MYSSAIKLALIEAGALTTEFCTILGLADTFGDMVNCAVPAPSGSFIEIEGSTDLIITESSDNIVTE